MKDNNQLDELFRSKLGGFEQEPPAYIWSRIQEQQAGSKRRLLFFYLKGAGIAATILLAFLLGWQLQHEPHKTTPVLTEGQMHKTEVPDLTNTQNQPVETEVEQSLSKETHAVPNPKNEVYAATINKAPVNIHERNSSESPEDEVIAALELAKENKENLTNSEIRKQETEQFHLLQLLNIQLDKSFNRQAQLAEMKKEMQDTSSIALNPLELTVVAENARLVAQNNVEDQSGSWQLSAMVAPGYAVNQGSQSHNYESSMAYSASTEDLNLSGGITIEYKNHKRWSVQSGVYYNKLGQTSTNHASNSEMSYDSPAPGAPTVGADLSSAYYNTVVKVASGQMQMNTAAGVVEIDNLPTNARLSNSFESLTTSDGILLTETDFEQRFEYIEVPLIFRYQLIDAVIDMQLLGGFNASVLVANNAYARSEYGRERIGETRDMNSVNYSTSFGFGLGYGLSDKISIRVEPQLKYFLGSLNNNSEVDYKPYTIGIYTGLSYQF